MMHVYFFPNRLLYTSTYFISFMIFRYLIVVMSVVNRFIAFFLLRLIKILINKNGAKISIYRDFFFAQLPIKTCTLGRRITYLLLNQSQ